MTFEQEIILAWFKQQDLSELSATEAYGKFLAALKDVNEYAKQQFNNSDLDSNSDNGVQFFDHY